MTKDENMFYVRSMYGVETNMAIVELEIRGKRHQISSEEARRVAMLMLECAEASEQDGALFNWGIKQGFPKEKAAQLVLMLRKYKESIVKPEAR
jgi:hypothetical protein